MKKSVVILIAIIYVAAIGLVSFFGLQFNVFEEVIPVEKIEIVNSGLKTDLKGSSYIVISPDKDGNRALQLEYELTPSTASNKQVHYEITASPDGCATVTEFGMVIFKKAGTAKVFIVAADGSNAEATLTIISK